MHLYLDNIMEAEEALSLFEHLLIEQDKRLNDLQRLVFLGAWQGKDYNVNWIT
jgi:hypothetical protein